MKLNFPSSAVKPQFAVDGQPFQALNLEMMNSDYWINAVGVLKASTRQMLAAQVSKEAVIVLDGWCATNNRQMKAWEKDGSLSQRAQEVSQQIREVLEQYEKGKRPGDPALANHEIYQIYGKPQLVL